MGAARPIIRCPRSTSLDTTTNLELLLGGDWKVFHLDSPKLDISTTVSVIPSITDLGRVRLQWDYRLSHEVLSDFFVGLKGFVSYDSRPPTTNAVKSDYRLNFTVGWTWG